MSEIKITIVGCGNVGNAVATIILNRFQTPVKLNIMEPSDHQNGRILEIHHMAALHGIHHVTINNVEEFADAEFVFHTAGKCMQANQSRLDVAEGNWKLTKLIFEHITFTRSPSIIVLTNPVDVITFKIQELTGLPKNQVIGTGTLLDSARFSANLVRHAVTEDYIPALVVGEHGDSMVPLFSLLNDEYNVHSLKEEVLKIIEYDTIFAAKEIKQTQDHTSTGVASVAVLIMEQIINQSDTIQNLPVSCVTDDELQVHLGLSEPIAISWFYNLQNGAKSCYHISLSDEELTKFKRSAQILAAQIKELS